MIIGYAYGRARTEAMLRAIGCERTFVDRDGKRRERAEMMNGCNLREGDTLRVLYFRDLGGSPVADRVWREKVEAMGVKVEEVRPASRPVGPPRKFDPPADLVLRIRDIWLDGNRSERDRLQAVADAYAPTTRGVLNNRFGWPTRPKPIN